MFLFYDEIIVLSSLFSSVFHEAGHFYYMLRYGHCPESIVLGPFGMRIVKMNSPYLSYNKEIFISLGGIIFNFFLIIFSYIFYLITYNHYFIALICINIMIVIINSFPVGILDAGRALKCFLLLRIDEEKASLLNFSDVPLIVVK